MALALAMLAACQPATVSNGPGVGQGQAAPPSSQQPVTATRPPDAPPPALPGTLPFGSGPGSQPGQAAPLQQLPAEKRDRVALLVPLSGRAAALGQSFLEAAQLALFDIADERFTLLVYDTLGTPAGAEDAARLAITEGAGLILGPVYAQSAEAVRPIAAAAGVRVLSFSNNGAIAGNGLYLLGLLPDQQVARVVGYAVRRGYNRIGMLVPSTPFGEAVATSARNAAAASGAAVTKTGSYDPGSNDLNDTVRSFADYDRRRAAMRAERQRLTSEGSEIARQTLARMQGVETIGDPPYDALLLPEGGASLRNIAPLLAYYDIDPGHIRMLGTAIWEQPGLGREPTLVGGWFAAAPPELRAGFEERFTQTFEHRPNPLASLAYDATALAITLFLSEGGPVFDDVALTSPSGFSGVNGIFRLLPNGLNQRGLSILEVRKDGFGVVDKAPQTFENFAM